MLFIKKKIEQFVCQRSNKIIFYQKKRKYIFIIIFKLSKLANTFPISKRGNKKVKLHSNFQ